MQNFTTIKLVGKIAILFILLAVGLLGYLPIKDLPIREGKIILIGWIFVIFMAVFYVDNIWIGLFLIWSLIGVIIANHPASFQSLVVLILGIVFYQTIKSEKCIKSIHFLNILRLIAVIQMAWMLMQWQGYWLGFTPNANEVNPIVGWLENTNLSGAFIALTIPLFLVKGKKWYRPSWWWLIPVAIFCLYLSQCVTALVALLAGVLFYVYFGIKKYRSLVTVALLLFGVVFMLHVGDISHLKTMSHRLPVWKILYERVFPIHPVRGMGLGMFKVIWTPLHASIDKCHLPFETAHNVYLQLLVEQGIVGLGLVLFFIGGLFMKFFRRKTEVSIILFTCIVVGLVDSMANFLMSVPIGALLIIYFAIFEREVLDDRR